MKKELGFLCASLCSIALAFAGTASAQSSEVKEKPAMYTYVSDWAIPRAQWADVDKNTAMDDKTLQKALASGTLVGYGHDTTLVHQNDGYTHDDWWSAMSMAGLMNVLDQFYKSGSTTTPVLVSATRHADAIYESRYYNWHPGTYKDVYTHAGFYKLKPDAPDDAVDTLAKSFVVPLMEKLLADGAIHEYEIDVQSIHTDTPGSFAIVYIAANADGLDKVNAAVDAALKGSPLAGPAFGSMVDFSAHRDELLRSNATYK
jgi:hypothetical protein